MDDKGPCGATKAIWLGASTTDAIPPGCESAPGGQVSPTAGTCRAKLVGLVP